MKKDLEQSRSFFVKISSLKRFSSIGLGFSPINENRNRIGFSQNLKD
ncbi:hypothetical protein ABEG63_09830 [Chryseobacterium sp. C39-AII1]